MSRSRCPQVSSFSMDLRQAYQALDWEALVDWMKKRASSQVGRDTLQNLKAFLDPIEAEEQSRKVEKLAYILKIYNERRKSHLERPQMKSLDFYSSWKERLHRRASLTLTELKNLLSFLEDGQVLKEFFHFAKGVNGETNTFDLEFGRIKISKSLSALHQVITEEGEVRVDATPLLLKLYREKNKKIKHIQKSLDQFVKDHHLKHLLQERYVTTREGRWVLPIKSGMRERFEGIIHAMSQSHQTVFMEPLLVVEMNNQVHRVMKEMEKEVDRVLFELSQFLFSLSKDLESNQNILLQYDVLLSQALLSLELRATSFRFKESFDLVDVRHPLLELDSGERKRKASHLSDLDRSQETYVVPNDVHLDRERRILLLSGANAGGKTVFLKAIGLASQMARFGLPICAKRNSSLPFFSHIHILIGDLQCVKAHVSRFSSHLQTLNQLTKAEGFQELLLVDEICGSTDSEEGIALARSFIQHYASQNVYALITSHLRGLSFNWPHSSGICVGSFEFSSKKGPTYKFVPGQIGRSWALNLAEQVGVSEAIIKRARDFLGSEEQVYFTQMKEVEHLQEELHSLKEKGRKEVERAKEQQREYERLKEEFRKEKEKSLMEVLKQSEDKVDKLLKEVERKNISYRKESLEKLKSSLPEVIKVPRQKKSLAPQSLKEFSLFFPPGTLVFLLSLNQKAVIQDTPNRKGEVTVLAQSMRWVVSWRDVQPLPTEVSTSFSPLSKYLPLGHSGEQSRKSALSSSHKFAFSSEDSPSFLELKDRNLKAESLKSKNFQEKSSNKDHLLNLLKRRKSEVDGPERQKKKKERKKEK